MFSLMKLILVLKDMGIPASIFPITFDSLVNRARNAAVAYFMSDEDHTHLLFLDADIEFEVQTIIDLLQANRPVIGVGYAQKWLNQQKVIHVFSTNPLPEKPLELCTNGSIHLGNNPVEGHIQDVEYCTTGCLLIQRSVIQTMIEKYPERQYANDIDGYMGAKPNLFYNFFAVEIHPETRRFESEDYGFCRLWKQTGGAIHVWTNASLTHYGWFGYPYHLGRQERSEGGVT